ncbi:MAG: hypothetical protein H7308_14760 [Chthonomonadaceae bacterium]|nr:hypothetical protein [Chthonomonadaceae bacterium]
MAHHFSEGNGFSHLTQIAPSSTEIIYWIVEDVQFRPGYRTYEASVETIQSVIGECYGFEYTLIAKDLRWLICETHSDVVIATGEEVEQNLKTLIA